jgi:predicted metalloprotease
MRLKKFMEDTVIKRESAMSIASSTGHSGLGMKRTVTAMMVVMLSMLYAVFGQAQILATSQLNIERRAHTATLLNDGKVLIVGGDNQSGMGWA